MEKQSHKRLKVLLGCYACDPHRGSEPGTGWNFAINISRYHDVHAIVEEGEFRESLEKFSQEHPDTVRHITFHFVPRDHHETLRKIWPPSYYWFYRAWHKRAYQYAVELDKKENFDIVHQVSMVGYREPGYLWKLGKPFIWGPLGGFKNMPLCLLKGLEIRDFIYFSLRNIINSYQKRFSLAAKTVSRVAHTILVSDPLGKKVIKSLWNRNSIIMKEVGTYKVGDIPDICEHNPGTPLRVYWAGTLVTLKALPLLLNALTICKSHVQLEVLGAGNKENKWKQLVKDLNLEHCVHFNGFIPHAEIYRVMRTCHVMCITSIHEGGTPNITVEALQGGLPIVALDHCGFASVIDDTCGIKIPIQSQAEISVQLAKALDRLAEDEDLRLRLAHGAYERSKDFTWDAKMQVLNRVYAEAAAGNQVN